MTLVSALLEFAAAAGIVVVAASALTRFADAIARFSGLGRLFVGSLLLAGATSLPEFIVDFHAVRSGMANLAAGDLFGSSLFNLLILSGANIATRTSGGLNSHAAPRHFIAAISSIVLTSLVVMAILSYSQPQIPRVGLFEAAILMTYLIGLRLILRSRSAEIATPIEPAPQRPDSECRAATAISGFVASAAVILLVAPHVASSAGQIATLSGLGESFIGTTLVAASTSLPELAATITALRIGSSDLALGNILGSNAFNMTLFVPLEFACQGSLFGEISSTHILSAMAVIIATSITALSFLHCRQRKIQFLDPDGWLVIFVASSGIVLSFIFR